jgi:hypothetical protein
MKVDGDLQWRLSGTANSLFDQYPISARLHFKFNFAANSCRDRHGFESNAM